MCSTTEEGRPLSIVGESGCKGAKGLLLLLALIGAPSVTGGGDECGVLGVIGWKPLSLMSLVDVILWTIIIDGLLTTNNYLQKLIFIISSALTGCQRRENVAVGENLGNCDFFISQSSHNLTVSVTQTTDVDTRMIGDRFKEYA